MLIHAEKRLGATTLFAALSVTNGTLISHCQQRHRRQEWIRFLELIDRKMLPESDLHLIVDNDPTSQRCPAQASEGQSLAAAASAIPCAFRFDQQFLAE